MTRTTEQEFWHQIWTQESQGFHEGKTNFFLAKHIERFAQRPRVLAPLCGRAHDLRFLADRGHDVTGIELVESAARGFFEEQGLAVTERYQNNTLVLESGSLRILVSDVLDVSPEEFGTYDAIYDRAAAVALPLPTRLQYAQVMQNLLAPNGAIFLVTFVDPTRDHGPPFAFDEDGVRAMYPNADITCIDVLDPQKEMPHLPPAMTQKVFWIR